MEKREVNGSVVSLLGMGCMRFPTLENGEIDIVQTEKMIDLAYEKGINYFDTAYPYHNGQSEIVLGNILKKYPRESFFITDKMPIWKCETLEDVKRIFNEELEKCQVEYFDFYLCHAMNIGYYNKYKELGAFDYLVEMKKEGKIKRLGFSFHDAAQNIIPIADELDWDFAQIQFNYLDFEMQDAKKQYEELTKRNISVIVMEPVRGGMLANVCEEATDLFEKYNPNMSIASWALRYCASFPNIKVILSGMSNLEQLEDNLNTFINYKELNEEEKELIQKAKKAILGNDFIPCTGCRYCLPCSFGVNIPRIFRIYNMYGIHKDLERFKADMSKVEESELPKNCRSCKKCVKACPQGIKIDEKLKYINSLL